MVGMVSDFVLGSYVLSSKPKTKPDPTLRSLTPHSESLTPHSDRIRRNAVDRVT